ncbi:STAS domain-containing protein [Actinosynnema pretiosum subsp. pretiosum]|uniref:Anti-sigma factor antagonist n=3 Tax=Actinosynnema TaxID=40566 RepID=C6WA33_ACTMD|nr:MULTISPECIES: STAS domain-containing protein [Actinosynnema]ACU39222.1 anti-sigma-factor antagonist [Actinosynnema mirum DSM 43827]ATE56459.1 anti-sigma factor antagonist [Actinosynnema pretiosum]AXX32823.1 Anti-sigma F factor antagonist (spoIIAA-2), Anti-sigma B factor antagonist RsbV [Actinosynnema pretiosum subsp. pretiosum]QUF03304.1 STAS domain-containing protein [Actinosynnema pretiosum subsp. pretiosum]
MPEPATLASVRVEEPEDGVVVLHVSGELDTTSADELARPLKAHLGGGARSVVVDLGGVRFLGSAGLESLVMGRKLAEEQGVELALVASSRSALRPLQATGLDSVFTIKPTVEEALARG